MQMLIHNKSSEYLDVAKALNRSVYVSCYKSLCLFSYQFFPVPSSTEDGNIIKFLSTQQAAWVQWFLNISKSCIYQMNVINKSFGLMNTWGLEAWKKGSNACSYLTLERF